MRNALRNSAERQRHEHETWIASLQMTYRAAEADRKSRIRNSIAPSEQEVFFL